MQNPQVETCVWGQLALFVDIDFMDVVEQKCVLLNIIVAILGSWIHSYMYHPQWPSDFANAILMRPTGCMYKYYKTNNSS